MPEANMEGGLKDGQVVAGDGNEPAKPVEKPAAPVVKMVEVEIGGVKANVPESFVTEFQKIERGYTDLRAEVDALKKPAPKKVDGQPDPNDPLGDIETELFANPKEAVAKIIAVARQQASDEVTGKIGAQTAQKEFWDQFYKTNTDLDRETDGDVVAAVMNREYSSLSTLKVPEAIKALGEKSKAALLKIAQKRGAPAETPKPDAEGGNEPSKKGSKGSKDNVSPHSAGLSGVIKARQQARRAAAKA